MRNLLQEKAAGRERRALLMAEFSVQVFSDGRVDWGELRRFIQAPEVDIQKLMGRLMAEGRRQ